MAPRRTAGADMGSLIAVYPAHRVSGPYEGSEHDAPRRRALREQAVDDDVVEKRKCEEQERQAPSEAAVASPKTVRTVPRIDALRTLIAPAGNERWAVRCITASMSRSTRFVQHSAPALRKAIAATTPSSRPVGSEPDRMRASTLPVTPTSTNVASICGLTKERYRVKVAGEPATSTLSVLVNRVDEREPRTAVLR